MGQLWRNFNRETIEKVVKFIDISHEMATQDSLDGKKYTPYYLSSKDNL